MLFGIQRFENVKEFSILLDSYLENEDIRFYKIEIIKSNPIFKDFSIFIFREGFISRRTVRFLSPQFNKLLDDKRFYITKDQILDFKACEKKDTSFFFIKEDKESCILENYIFSINIKKDELRKRYKFFKENYPNFLLKLELNCEL